ncbi:MAG TPA: EamA family transporter, partial [Cryomorphaceae bacterium]|nr:EamA family transporter [Cryomorphaceae bacterium]
MSKNATLTAWAVFVGLAITWGSSFILMKFGLQSFTSSQIGMLRISLAFLFTAVIGYKHFSKLNRKNAFPLLVVGLLGNGIPYILFPLAIRHLDSSLVGILNSLVPLFTLLIGVFWFGIRIKWLSMLGIMLGLAGAIWLLVPDMEVGMNNLTYGIYPIIATVCYAVSINTINSKLKDLGSFAITLLSLMFIGIPAIIYVLSTDFLQIMQSDPGAWRSLGYVSILGVVGTSVAVILFNYLIKTSGSLFAASVTYIVPVIALIWGVVDGEDVGVTHVFGMA